MTMRSHLTGVEMPALLSKTYPAIDVERCIRDMNFE